MKLMKPNKKTEKYTRLNMLMIDLLAGVYGECPGSYTKCNGTYEVCTGTYLSC